jgi:hypothetical protein
MKPKSELTERLNANRFRLEAYLAWLTPEQQKGCPVSGQPT